MKKLLLPFALLALFFLGACGTNSEYNLARQSYRAGYAEAMAHNCKYWNQKQFLIDSLKFERIVLTP